MEGTHMLATPSGVRSVSRAYLEVLNLVTLVMHHREHCDESCAVSLSMLKPVAVRLAQDCAGAAERADAFALIAKAEWM